MKHKLLFLISPFIFVMVFFILSSPVMAGTYYVSPTGSASWVNSTNISTPCSVAIAFANAQAGDTVLFRGGTYNVPAKNSPLSSYRGYYEPVHSGTGDSDSERIIFKAYPGEAPIFNGTAGGAGDSPYYATIIGTHGYDYITFDGFTFQSDGGTKMARLFIGTDLGNGSYPQTGEVSKYIKIKNCVIDGGSSLTGGVDDNYECVRIEHANNIVFENTVIKNAQRSTTDVTNTVGVKVYFSYYLTFTHCEFTNNNTSIYLKNDSTDVTVSYCYFHDDVFSIGPKNYDMGASALRNCDRLTVHDNLFINSRGAIAAVQDSRSGGSPHQNDFVCYNNTFYNVGQASNAAVGFGDSQVGHGAKIYNNIIYAASSGRSIFSYWCSKLAEEDHNQFGATRFYIYLNEYGSTNGCGPYVTYSSFSSWQSSNELVSPVDLGCGSSQHPGCRDLTSNPLFVNSSGNLNTIADFALAPGSPSKGTGRNGADMGASISLVGVNASPITPPADTTPPIISNGSPSGTLAANTTQTTLQVTTNENATCRYTTTANIGYNSMTNFSSTGGTTHTKTITGLTNGSTYNYYVRCQDSGGYTNAVDYTITFLVSSATSIYYVSPKGSATLDKTDEGATAWTNAKNISTPCSAGTAMARAVADDIVYFRGGTYNINYYGLGSDPWQRPGMYPAHSGTPSHYITFMAYPGEIPTIVGLTNSAAALCYGPYIHNYIIFDGFHSYGVSDGTYDPTGHPYGTIVAGGIKVGSNTYHGADYTQYTDSVGCIIRNCVAYGGSAAIAGADNAALIRIEDATNLLVQNCKLYFYTTNTVADSNTNHAAVEIYYSTGVTVENCEIYNAPNALYNKTGAGPYNTFRYNYIHDCYHPFFNESAYYSNNYIVFHDNVMVNNRSSNYSSFSIAKAGNPTSSNYWSFYNNTLYGPTASLIYFHEALNINVYNNILIKTNSCGSNATLWPGYSSEPNNSLASWDHNQYGPTCFSIKVQPTGTEYTSLANWKASTELIGGASPGVGDLTSDPLFVNSSRNMNTIADFVLQSNSPCKGTGRNGVDMGANISLVGVNASPITPPTDTTPPVIFAGQPTGALAADTTQTTLSVITNENATCRYYSTANTSYAGMSNYPFTTTGGTNHRVIITGLANGRSYTYYIRCQDTAGNANASDYTITFSVAQPGIVACTSFTYTAWSACNVDGVQARNVVTSSPSGCTGGSPVLFQSCTYIPTCASFTYSAWGACSINGTQTRTITAKNPANCTGGTPEALTQTCTYHPTCTSFTYTAWSACNTDGLQARNVVTSSPTDCTGGSPVLFQKCTYAPTCTDFTYTAWSACNTNGVQARNVVTSSPSGCTGGSPVLFQSCTYVPTCTSFTYSNWSVCSINNTQTRTVATSLPTGCTGGSPVLTQSCTYTPPVTTCSSFTYSVWSACSANGTQTRTVTASSPSGCTGGTPVLTQSCTYIPTCTSFTYSAWSACNANNYQTRTVTAKTPTNCTGGTPEALTQTCTYHPTCTSFTYTAWSACNADGLQARNVVTNSPTDCTGGSPVLFQKCTYIPPCTDFTYSAWGSCQNNNTQYRTVAATVPIKCIGGSPVTTQSCTYTGNNNANTNPVIPRLSNTACAISPAGGNFFDPIVITITCGASTTAASYQWGRATSTSFSNNTTTNYPADKTATLYVRYQYYATYRGQIITRSGVVYRTFSANQNYCKVNPNGGTFANNTDIAITCGHNVVSGTYQWDKEPSISFTNSANLNYVASQNKRLTVTFTYNYKYGTATRTGTGKFYKAFNLRRCTDTENGTSYFFPGTNTYAYNTTIRNYADTCSGTTVTEYYCDANNYPRALRYRCPYGCAGNVCKIAP